MRSSATAALIVVMVAAVIMALGYAVITGIPYSHKTQTCVDHEMALLVWSVLAGLVVTAVGAVILAWLKSPVGGYVLLVGVLTLGAGIGVTLSIETHEFCGRESWWMEGALLAGLTLIASLAGLSAGFLGWQLAHD